MAVVPFNLKRKSLVGSLAPNLVSAFGSRLKVKPALPPQLEGRRSAGITRFLHAPPAVLEKRPPPRLRPAAYVQVPSVKEARDFTDRDRYRLPRDPRHLNERRADVIFGQVLEHVEAGDVIERHVLERELVGCRLHHGAAGQGRG